MVSGPVRVLFIVLLGCAPFGGATSALAAPTSNTNQNRVGEPRPPVSGDVVPPVPLERVAAVYPEGARARGDEGTVVLFVTVLADGSVGSVEVDESRGAELDGAAVEAARRWRFQPAERGGRAVPSRIRVPFTFVKPVPPPAPAPPVPAGAGAAPVPATETSQAPPTVPAETRDASPPPPDEAPSEVDVRATRAAPHRAASDFTVGRAVLTAAPHQDAGDLLKTAPGFSVNRIEGDAVASAITLRGFDAEHGQDIEFTAAGIPINQRSHLHGQGYADLNFIPPEVVRSVRATEGVYDPHQGDFAVAGSVDFDLGVEERGIQLRSSYGSFGTTRQVLIWAPPEEAPETFGILALSSSDGYGENRGSASGSAMAQYRFGSDRLHGTVHAAAYGARASFPGVVREDDVRNGSVDFYGGYPDATARAQSALATKTQLGVQIVAHQPDDSETGMGAYLAWSGLRLRENLTGYTERSNSNPDWVGRGDLIEQGNRAWTLGANARHRTARFEFPKAFTRGYGEVGLDTRLDLVDQEQNLLESPQNETWDQRVDASVRGAGVGGFADLAVSFAGRVRLHAGARADALYYDVDDRLGNYIPRFSRQTYIVGFRRTALGLVAGPRASLETDPARWLTLVTAYGEGFRSPQARQLEEGETAPYAKVRSAEVGARAHFGRSGAPDTANLTLAVFRTSLSTDMAFDPQEGRLERIGPTTRVGSVLHALLQPEPWLTASGSVTVVRATLDAPPPATAANPTPPYESGELLPYVPPVVGRADVGVHGPLGRVGGGALDGRAGVGFSYLSPRPLPFGQFGSSTTLLDAAIGVRWRALELAFDGYNLLDLEYRADDYAYVSNWHPDGTPSRIPARHFVAGPPLTVLGTLAVHL